MFNFRNRYTEDDVYENESGMPVCKKCGGELAKRLPVGDTEVLFPKLCECRAKEVEEFDRSVAESKRMENIKRLRYTGIPEILYRQHTFENDDSPRSDASVLAKKYVAKWDEMQKKGYGLLFTGGIGTGKSFYACCIANALIDREIQVIVTSFDRILLDASNFDDRKKTMDRLRTCKLLVLDDLGVERQTDYGLEVVYNVINERIKSGLPMIVTTNMTIEQLKKAPTMAMARIFDRVLHMCPIRMTMVGKSRRDSSFMERLSDVKSILIEGEENEG